jgi:hypothetical protein
MFQVLNASKLPANLFLKHLVVLADFGGEMLQRLNSQFNKLFPQGQLTYIWNEKQFTYRFQALPVRGGLTNAKLGISGERLLKSLPLKDLSQDVIAILLFGAAAFDERTAEILTKCEIGTYIGQFDKLNKFIQQRYIWVSRITSGSQANQLGQIAQNFVRDYLTENLDIDGANIQRESYLPGVSHSDPTTNRPTSFDIVVSKGEKYVAIEVSFQVTTNSTIERKAGQARSRFEQVELAGHRIAYVLDGSGNFQRENALRTICTHSHCTVAFSHSELDVLCQFIKTYL